MHSLVLYHCCNQLIGYEFATQLYHRGQNVNYACAQTLSDAIYAHSAKTSFLGKFNKKFSRNQQILHFSPTTGAPAVGPEQKCSARLSGNHAVGIFSIPFTATALSATVRGLLTAMCTNSADHMVTPLSKRSLWQ